MTKNIIRGFLIVLGLLVTINAFATDSPLLGKTVEDQTLERNVSTVLKEQFPTGSYTILSYKQNVLLAGQVPNLEMKNKINLVIKDVGGVRKLWNELKVKPNEAATEQAKDAALTALAKARLIAQKEVNATNIKVVTCDKVVYLLGENPGDKKQLDLGIRGIQQIKGVERVINHIQ